MTRMQSVAIASLAVGMAGCGQPASPPEAMVGQWHVTREAPDRCFADLHMADGLALTFLAHRGGVGFAVYEPAPVAKGQRLRLAMDTAAFVFAPAYRMDGKIVYLDGELSAEALAALRVAKGVTVSLDDRVLISPRVEGTGLAEALDGIVVCSNGKKAAWEAR